MLNGSTGLVSKDCSNSGDSTASEALCHLSWHPSELVWPEKSPLTDVSKQEVCERMRGTLNSPLELTGKIYPSRGYENPEKVQEEPGSCRNASHGKRRGPS